jgi:molybdopterin/thiamine biosynthesis adenylyltransferase
MSNPQVYMLEKQIKEIYSKHQTSPDENLHGVAFSFDSGDVFHVYTDFPEYPVGYLGPVSFHFLSETPNETELQLLVDKIKQDIDTSSYPFVRHMLAIILYVNEDTIAHWVYIFDRDLNTFQAEIKLIPGRSELYSRSEGILETSLLENSKVGIVGLGSGGSAIAVELAKAGVGKFVLIDFDRLELSNIARHASGIQDLGRYKTKAVKDLVRAKNPYAEVYTGEFDINVELQNAEELLNDCDLIIAATDNNRSRYNINDISIKHGIVSLFPRALTRAVGGDILRVRPKLGPCLACFLPKANEEEVSSFDQARRQNPAYVGDQDLQAVIQVGLSSDILPIANMTVKLALVELSRDTSSGLSSLEEDFIADYYIWANRRDNKFVDWPKMEFGTKSLSILRWYGARLSRKDNCLSCAV